MKAITLWQPWASLVALGIKTVETRSWATKYRGPLAIHAAKRKPTAPEAALLVEAGVCSHIAVPLIWSPSDPLVPFGSVLATCTLVDAVPIHEWGCYCDHEKAYAMIARAGGDPIVGLFDGDGRGYGNPDWGPSHLDVLDPRHPRQQAPWGDYRCGRFAWLLDDVKPLPQPAPASGRQQLWEWQE